MRDRATAWRTEDHSTPTRALRSGRTTDKENSVRFVSVNAFNLYGSADPDQ